MVKYYSDNWSSIYSANNMTNNNDTTIVTQTLQEISTTNSNSPGSVDTEENSTLHHPIERAEQDDQAVGTQALNDKIMVTQTSPGTYVANSNSPASADTKENSALDHPNEKAEHDDEGVGTQKPDVLDSTNVLQARGKVPNLKLLRIAYVIHRYVFIAIIPPLIICNAITFIVMNMKHNRDRSACVYMAALAGVDTAFLLYGLWYSFTLSPPGNLECKTIVYMLHVIWTLSAWYIMAMCFDRCYAVVQPHKAKIKCTAKRARTTIIVLFVVFIIFYGPLAVFAGNDSSNQCVRYNMEAWYVSVYIYMSLVVYPVIPIQSHSWPQRHNPNYSMAQTTIQSCTDNLFCGGQSGETVD